MALTNDDLNNIRQVVKEEFVIGFSSIWEDNLEPNMVVKKDLEELEVGLKKDNQDTRDFIAKQVVKLSGTSVSRDKGLEKRIELTGKKLVNNKVLTNQDLKDVTEIPVFQPNQM